MVQQLPLHDHCHHHQDLLHGGSVVVNGVGGSKGEGHLSAAAEKRLNHNKSQSAFKKSESGNQYVPIKAFECWIMTHFSSEWTPGNRGAHHAAHGEGSCAEGHCWRWGSLWNVNVALVRRLEEEEVYKLGLVTRDSLSLRHQLVIWFYYSPSTVLISKFFFCFVGC